MEKEADLKRTVEITALAVRGLICKDLGAYCKIYYGGNKRKSKKLRKDSGGEWKPKHPITMNTQGPSDLVIECWKKQRGKLMKKFLGRISFLSSQMESINQIKGWYELGGRGKESEEISGNLYILATMPGKPKSLNHQFTEERIKRINPPDLSQIGIVFDRTHELHGKSKQEQSLLMDNIVQDVISSQKVGSPLPEKDEFKRKIDLVSNLNDESEKELRSLNSKINDYEKTKNKVLARKEIEGIINGLKENIQLGITTLRELGEELNHNSSENDLRIKMQQSNSMLHHLTIVVDELNLAKQKLKDQNILL